MLLAQLSTPLSRFLLISLPQEDPRVSRRDGAYKHLGKPQQRDWIWSGNPTIPHAQVTAPHELRA